MKTRFCLFAAGAMVAFATAAETQPEPPKPLCCQDAPPAGPYSEKSVFSLPQTWTSDFGKEVKLGLLRGKPFVLALFFTQCQHSCPYMVQDLKEVERKLPQEIRERTNFVLASIDPAHDTVEALRAYRQKYDLHPDRWLLLRADQPAVDALAGHIGFRYTPGSENQFAHSLLLTVFNSAGEIVFQQAGIGVDRRDAVKAIQKLATGGRGR